MASPFTTGVPALTTQNSPLAPFDVMTGGPTEAVKTGGGFWDVLNTVTGAIGTVANTAATVKNAFDGKTQTVVVQSPSSGNLSGLLGGAVGAGNAVQGGSITSVADYVDSYLANSKTLEKATNNIGASATSSLAGMFDKYKTLIIIGFVLIMVVWFVNSSNKH